MARQDRSEPKQHRQKTTNSRRRFFFVFGPFPSNILLSARSVWQFFTGHQSGYITPDISCLNFAPGFASEGSFTWQETYAFSQEAPAAN